MYQMRYEDVMTDDMASARERERTLFDRSIAMLELAKENGSGSREGDRRDLFHHEALDHDHRRSGVGGKRAAEGTEGGDHFRRHFVLKEIERIRQGESNDYATLIEITQSIRDGL